MQTISTYAGFSRASAMLAVLLVVFAAFDSNASITVTKTNATGASVNGGALNQTISFGAGDFPGGAVIGKAIVQITFSKTSALSFLRPMFNEVGFTLTSPDGTSVDLIRGAANNGGGSFNQGQRGANFSGTITFDQSAADAVNNRRNLIQEGTFLPDGGDLSGLNGESAVGNWTLTISDANSGTVLNSAVEVTSWSVSVTTVPEPDSIALWSMTCILAALIVFHRPRRPLERVC